MCQVFLFIKWMTFQKLQGLAIGNFWHCILEFSVYFMIRLNVLKYSTDVYSDPRMAFWCPRIVTEKHLNTNLKHISWRYVGVIHNCRTGRESLVSLISFWDLFLLMTLLDPKRRFIDKTLDVHFTNRLKLNSFLPQSYDK